MNKIFLKIFFTGVIALAVSSCKKNNLVVDKNIVPPSTAKFSVRQNSDTAGTYFITSTGGAYKIPIAINTVSDKDRTIQLCYSSTSAVAGQQYNAPATIVIPAGKTVDTLLIQGLYAGYTSSKVDVLFIKICGGDVPANAYWNTYKLTMRKFCDVNLTAFAGNYTRTMDNGNYGPYTTSITPGIATGTKGYVMIQNIWDPGVPTNTKVDLDWSSPASLTATIADQVYYAAGDLWIKGTSTGSFSSCDQTFTLRYTLYYKSTGVNWYANQVTTIAR